MGEQISSGQDDTLRFSQQVEEINRLLSNRESISPTNNAELTKSEKELSNKLYWFKLYVEQSQYTSATQREEQKTIVVCRTNEQLN